MPSEVKRDGSACSCRQLGRWWATLGGPQAPTSGSPCGPEGRSFLMRIRELPPSPHRSRGKEVFPSSALCRLSTTTTPNNIKRVRRIHQYSSRIAFADLQASPRQHGCLHSPQNPFSPPVFARRQQHPKAFPSRYASAFKLHSPREAFQKGRRRSVTCPQRGSGGGRRTL